MHRELIGPGLVFGIVLVTLPGALGGAVEGFLEALSENHTGLGRTVAGPWSLFLGNTAWLVGGMFVLILMSRLQRQAGNSLWNYLRIIDAKQVAVGLLSGVSLFALLLILRIRMPVTTILSEVEIRTNSLTGRSPLFMIWYGLTTVLVFPFVEEMIYRGGLLIPWTQRYGKARAILATSGLFALGHWDIRFVMTSFIAGLLLGFLSLQTSSVGVSLLAHSMYNSLVLVFWFGRGSV